jgi:hypothetical protein
MLYKRCQTCGNPAVIWAFGVVLPILLLGRAHIRIFITVDYRRCITDGIGRDPNTTI